MLALTPVPLKTAGERAVFGELTRWDTGGSVRAAVMASIPLADGSSQRRMSDAVLFVPEGVAVVRIAEVAAAVRRRDGVPRGAVDHRPGVRSRARPSSSPAAGSTPLDGLMRAGMDTAMKLRRAGLEPGRIARLTVLVGDVTGLLPADGDLGEGDQVATARAPLAAARASRGPAGTPASTTPASGRRPTSAPRWRRWAWRGAGRRWRSSTARASRTRPYVLRRAELLTPAAMAAASESAASQASAARRVALAPSAPAPPALRAVAQRPDTAPPVREQPAAAAIAQAVAASAAAARVRAARLPAAGLPGARAARHGRDRRTPAGGRRHRWPLLGLRDRGSRACPPGGRAAGRRSQTGRSHGAGVRPPGRRCSPRPSPPPRTSVFAAQSPEPAHACAATVRLLERVRGDRRGSGGRVGRAGRAEPPAPHRPGDPRGPRGRRPARRRRMAPAGRPGRRAAGRRAARRPRRPPRPDRRSGTSRRSAAWATRSRRWTWSTPASATPTARSADSFGTTDCTGLSRALYSADVGGEPVVVSVVRVQMPDAATARALRALADQNGSGNVSDLLREGVRYTGSPAELSGAEYASALSGPTVTIVEAAWAAEDGQLGCRRARPRSPARRWRWRSRPSPRADRGDQRSRRPRPCRPAGRPSPGGSAGRRCAAWS